jgi:hypothetical protein
MYNDANIKKIVKLLELRNRPLENIVWRCGKIGIEKEEVINSMDLLLDLEVVGTEIVEMGDGYNTRDKTKRYFLK